MCPLCSFGSGSRTRVRLWRTESCFACGECSTPTVSGLLRKRGSCAPSVFWSDWSGFTLAPPSTRTTSGARVPSPGHAGGLFRTTEKQKNMRAERASRRVMRGALGFSRGQRGEMQLARGGSCAPSVFWSERSGFTFAPPSARTTSGARVPSPGHAGGFFRTTEKQKNMGSETPSRRGVRGALGFSRGERGEMQLARGGFVPPLFFGRNGRVYICAPEGTNHFGSKGSESGTRRGLVPDDGKAEKHARRKSEPASDARGAWFFARATRRDAISKRGVLCPLCFLVGTVGVYICAPECTNHFGSKGSESGTRRGLLPDDGKAEKHGFRNAEPARRARGAWLFARGTRRDEISKRGSCAPSFRG